MLPSRQQQAEALVQAVQKHNPDVMIVDEIGAKAEVAAARAISQHGVLLVGTAHGHCLSSLLANLSSGRWWRLHLDVEQSADAQLAAPDASLPGGSSSSSSSSSSSVMNGLALSGST
ncbi:hypothetical protein COO60DRAFT_1635520 [Scenedesmus sp. NREL 46B-D3]|nr:hypothetical protein COO60DRAFT_1635520 [Scenedesmus sp. NREL 46B-D3]